MSKKFRESLGIRDNKSRLYFFRYLEKAVLRVCGLSLIIWINFIYSFDARYLNSLTFMDWRFYNVTMKQYLI